MDKTKLPPIDLYRKYLNIASLRFNLTLNECRDKFGLYSINQWEALFQNSKTKLMQKTQYSITPYKRGKFEDGIFRMAKHHNEGVAKIDFDILQAYCMAEHAQYPNSTSKPFFKVVKDEGKLYIYEGEELVLLVEEKIIVGSIEVDVMEEDLKQQTGGEENNN